MPRREQDMRAWWLTAALLDAVEHGHHVFRDFFSKDGYTVNVMATRRNMDYVNEDREQLQQLYPRPPLVSSPAPGIRSRSRVRILLICPRTLT